jgi:hypothetical protein
MKSPNNLLFRPKPPLSSRCLPWKQQHCMEDQILHPKQPTRGSTKLHSEYQQGLRGETIHSHSILGQVRAFRSMACR